MHSLDIGAEYSSIHCQLQIPNKSLLVKGLVVAQAFGQGQLESVMHLESLTTVRRGNPQLMRRCNRRGGYMSTSDLSQSPDTSTLRVV
jgi:hypothetical protein